VLALDDARAAELPGDDVDARIEREVLDDDAVCGRVDRRWVAERAGAIVVQHGDLGTDRDRDVACGTGGIGIEVAEAERGPRGGEVVGRLGSEGRRGRAGRGRVDVAIDHRVGVVATVTARIAPATDRGIGDPEQL
jgi:hypothetical protein